MPRGSSKVRQDFWSSDHPLVESHCANEFSPIGSDVVEQRHEAEVHVQLLMTVEERQTGIVSDKVYFDFLISTDHNNIFHHTCTGFPCELGEFEVISGDPFFGLSVEKGRISVPEGEGLGVGLKGF